MRAWLRLLLAIALTSAMAAPTTAQSTAASVSGTVRDEQGGVVSGASITLNNPDTGQARQTVTDATGNFRVIGLVPGHYELRIEHSGFAHVRRSRRAVGDRTGGDRGRPAHDRRRRRDDDGPRGESSG